MLNLLLQILLLEDKGASTFKLQKKTLQTSELDMLVIPEALDN
jgi:hypothetical protein